jgi:hypothetical protein
MYIVVGTIVTLALWPFPIFCTSLCLGIQQPHTLSTVQYTADRDVSKITWFPEMTAQVPISYYCKCPTVITNMWGHFRGLLVSITPTTVYHHLFKCMSFQMRVPVSSSLSILSWFLLKLSNSTSLVAEGLLWKPLAWLWQWTDHQ